MKTDELSEVAIFLYRSALIRARGSMLRIFDELSKASKGNELPASSGEELAIGILKSEIAWLTDEIDRL